MTRDRSKQVSSIGMFDTFKGIGMILIVFGHTFSDLYMDFVRSPLMLIPELLLSLAGVALMPAFFMISGYGFRKRPVGKCIGQQVSLLLKPYLYVASATTIFHLIFHYVAFDCWPASVRETLRVAGGFLLALPENMELFGISFFWCGAVWYMIALFEGWIILDVLMNRVNEKYMDAAVLLTVTAGWLSGWLARYLTGGEKALPFCISQGLVAVGFLYIGYRMKKNKILLRGLNRRQWIAVGLSCVFTWILITVSGRMDNMADGIWAAGPVSMLADAAAGAGIISLVLECSRFENILMSMLQVIGRDSLLIFCIHTVEMIAVPWYLLQERYAGHPFLCNLLILLLRGGIIAAVVQVIKFTARISRERKLTKHQ